MIGMVSRNVRRVKGVVEFWRGWDVPVSVTRRMVG